MSMKIQAGSKQTEVGVIPDDWKAEKLCEVADIIMGQSPLSASYNQKKEGIALINGPTEFTDKYPVKIQWTNSPTKLCKKGDILLCIRGSSTGRINISNDDYCIGRGVAAIRAKANSTNIFLEFQVHNAVKHILKLSAGSTFPNIDSQSLKNIDILLPPLPEQEAIAQSLSDVDTLITALDQVITKKRNIKQGTMQQLLTGKKRLPGFSGEWTVKRIGDICDFIVPGRNKPRNFDGNIPWITTPDLEDGGSVHKSKLGLCISRDEAKNVGSKIVPAGSVIMSCAGELGIVAFTKNEIVINQQLHAFIPSSIINALFLLNSIKAQKTYLDSVATKTAVPYLNKDNCNSIPILIPPLPEQKAIAQVLSDMDAEIEVLEKKRDKYKTIKQGMMQELLTGKTRLINS